MSVTPSAALSSSSSSSSASFLVLIIFSIVVLCILHCIKRYFTVWRYTEKLPGPFSFPILGNVLQVGFTIEDFLNTLLKWWHTNGCDKYRVWMLNQPYVVITNPKDIETVLSSTTLIEKADVYDFLKPWLGNGLLTSTGSKWHKHRKMITPSFHFKILTEFLDVMDHCAGNFIEKLTKLADNGMAFDIQLMASNYTLDVICESAFGTSLTTSENFNSDVVQSVYELCEIIPKRAFSVLKRFDFFYKLTTDYQSEKKALKILREFTSEIIEKRRKLLNETLLSSDKNKNNIDGNENEFDVKPKRAFLDNLLTTTIDGRPLTFDEIFEEVSTFMFEGHDTTKSAVTFGLYALSRFPEIQDKVFEEQKLIFGDNLKRSANYKELQEMHYLELVIKETLRLYPSVPLIGRYTRETYNLNGAIVPPNTTILAFLLAMGRNSKYFKDPLKFNPERFTAENRENENPFDYVPFSAGPRNCIGQKFAMLELKTILSKIVRYFEILPPYENCCQNYEKLQHHNHDVTDQGLEPPILSLAITLKSENGVKLRLKARKMD